MTQYLFVQYKRTELMDPVMGICPQTSFDHAGLSDEETIDVEEEVSDIDKKFDEGKCTEKSDPVTKGICV